MPPARQIRGLGPITLSVPDLKPTEAVLTTVMTAPLLKVIVRRVDPAAFRETGAPEWLERLPEGAEEVLV